MEDHGAGMTLRTMRETPVPLRTQEVRHRHNDIVLPKTLQFRSWSGRRWPQSPLFLDHLLGSARYGQWP